jgi:hypothetical protein
MAARNVRIVFLFILIAMLQPLRAMLVLERIKLLIDDIKASREWIQTVRPVWAFMSRAEAAKAMEGECDPAQLPEGVIDLLDEIMAEDPTIIHVSVIFDPAWAPETIARLEEQMAKETEEKGVQWENFVKPFMPYWKQYMGPWLCHIVEVSDRLALDCPEEAPGVATRKSV